MKDMVLPSAPQCLWEASAESHSRNSGNVEYQMIWYRCTVQSYTNSSCLRREALLANCLLLFVAIVEKSSTILSSTAPCTHLDAIYVEQGLSMFLLHYLRSFLSSFIMSILQAQISHELCDMVKHYISIMKEKRQVTRIASYFIVDQQKSKTSNTSSDSFSHKYSFSRPILYLLHRNGLRHTRKSNKSDDYYIMSRTSTPWIHIYLNLLTEGRW